MGTYGGCVSLNKEANVVPIFGVSLTGRQNQIEGNKNDVLCKHNVAFMTS